MTQVYSDLIPEIQTAIKTDFDLWVDLHNSELLMLNTGKAKKQSIYCLYSDLSHSPLGFGASINEAITDSLKQFDNKNEGCEILLEGLNLVYRVIEIEVSLTKTYILH